MYRNIGRIISSGTNSPPVAVSTIGRILLVPEDIIRPMVDTSAGGLLVPEDIIRPMFRYLCWWTISPRGY
jgi:hypothetical protein